MIPWPWFAFTYDLASHRGDDQDDQGDASSASWPGGVRTYLRPGSNSLHQRADVGFEYCAIGLPAIGITPPVPPSFFRIPPISVSSTLSINDRGPVSRGKRRLQNGRPLPCKGTSAEPPTSANVL